MGSLVHTLTGSQHFVMKFVLALLFLAGLAFAEPESEPVAEAEADPEALYHGYYGHPHRRFYGGLGYYGSPYYGGYYGHYAHPVTYTHGVAHPYVNLGYGLHYPYFQRKKPEEK